MKLSFLLMVSLVLVLLVPGLASAEPLQALISTDTETGSVQYEMPGSTVFQILAFKASVKVPEGTLIKTGANGIAKIEVFPGGHLLVMPNTSMVLSSQSVHTQGNTISNRQARVDLTSGTIKALLNRKMGDASPIDFAIKTPNAVAAAKGTTYIVCRIGQTTYVYVTNGTVTVNGTVQANVGNVVVIGPDGTPSVRPITALPQDVQDDLTSATNTVYSTFQTFPGSNNQTVNPVDGTVVSPGQ
jgi:hypothetical protein